MKLRKLDKDFYNQDTFILSKKLLGKYIVKKTNKSLIVGMIVETEMYIGPYDDASHSYNFKRTKRNEAMYLNYGTVYVYQIYGMYHCLNIVTGKINEPEAVLIRAVEPIDGIEIMQKNRKKSDIKNLTNGPSKLCMAFGIDKSLNKQNIFGDNFYIAEIENQKKFNIISSKRINIDYAKKYKDKLWRFYIEGNTFVSKK